MRGVKLALCAALLVWIIRSADLSAVFAALAGADPALLALAVSMQLLGAAIVAMRWQRLLAVRDVRPGFRYLWGSTVSAFFFRQFLPSVVGGDAIRSYDAWRAGATPGFSALSLVVDRLFGLLTLIGFVAIAALSIRQVVEDLPGFWLYVGIGLAVVGGGLGALLMPGRIPWPARMPAKLRRIADGLRAFDGARGVVLPCLGLSILLQINVVTFYFVLSQALDLGVSYGAFFAIVPVAIFAMMAPLSINAIGIREAIFILLLGLWGVDRDHALAFAWAEFGAILTAGLFGGIVYALRRGTARPPRVADTA
ncbi:flippase-like domain-containing protein [Jannaschia sp. S6380]|uniref:lysylphosphatidylglycerol synthase transmembrane domain-containing protein n=1 Tax=Jannaschia sp. S6380 TaxID=2926408 RepID=UPI001FF17BAD|nr:lysylphosphatidylglycerol synthase transmembrane domain-containing protein [Jannaschia sp. S6380]MCK0168493.1 flippase-like domain-containing protein [Jannaschia sp. S6380]